MKAKTLAADLSAVGTPLAWKILLASLALTVLEGAIRKWIIGSAFNTVSYVAYFSKDIVFGLLFFLPTKGTPAIALEVFRRWFVPGCFLTLCGALCSSTEEINTGGALLTLRALVFLPLVVYRGVLCIQGISLRSVAWFIGLLTILNFSLGVAQNQLPGNHMLNRYVADTMDIAATRTGVRATGTFSYVSGMTIISSVGVWAGIVLLSLSKTVRHQIFGWAVLASGIGCGLAAVSRGPIIMAGVMFSGWFLLYGGRVLKTSRSLVAGILLSVVVVFLGLTVIFADLGQGLLLRFQTSDDTTQERTLGQFTEALMAINMAPLGTGLGTEQVGRNAFSESQMSHTTFEAQLPRVVLETGVLGLAGFLVVCAGALLALQVAKSTVPVGEKSILLTTQLLLFSMFASNVVFNHVASAFVWMIFAAVMASLPTDRAPTYASEGLADSRSIDERFFASFR